MIHLSIQKDLKLKIAGYQKLDAGSTSSTVSSVQVWKIYPSTRFFDFPLARIKSLSTSFRHPPTMEKLYQCFQIFDRWHSKPNRFLGQTLLVSSPPSLPTWKTTELRPTIVWQYSGGIKLWGPLPYFYRFSWLYAKIFPRPYKLASLKSGSHAWCKCKYKNETEGETKKVPLWGDASVSTSTRNARTHKGCTKEKTKLRLSCSCACVRFSLVHM